MSALTIRDDAFEIPDDDDTCPVCGGDLSWEHDHKEDGTGLDDGPPLYAVRKKAETKSAGEYQQIRAQAWETRRKKYGQYGHR